MQRYNLSITLSFTYGIDRFLSFCMLRVGSVTSLSSTILIILQFIVFQAGFASITRKRFPCGALITRVITCVSTMY